MISPLSSDCLAACVWKCWNGLYFPQKKASVLLKGQKLNIILKYSGIKKLCIQHHICIQSSLFIIDAINKVRPAAVKGQYLKSVTLTSTMGPGVKINPMKLV